MLRVPDVREFEEKPAGEAPLLDIRELKTHFATDEGVVQAVDGVDSPSTAARRSASSASPAAARPSPRSRC